jgi:hypothetical protein|tara:strand:+ start:545 stop:757 length:213 start_codon:yes stop_codon:yes gene_type:complete
MKLDDRGRLEFSEAKKVMLTVVDFYIAWLKFLPKALLTHKTFLNGYLQDDLKEMPEEEVVKKALEKILNG